MSLRISINFCCRGKFNSMVNPGNNTEVHIRTKVLSFCQGDNDAFVVLFKLWQTELYFHVYYFIKNEQEVEDILADCFEKIVITSVEYRTKKFISEGVDFKSFLKKVLKNRALDVIKTNSNRLRILEKWGFSQVGISENAAFIEEQDVIISRLLRPLEPKEREIFSLHMQGFNLDEISSRFLVSKKTVSNIIAISKRKLREFWGDSYPLAGS